MKSKLLLLVVGLQTAWVLGTVTVQERQLAEGQLVLLETRPVDPRDLLRGDYLILGYPIQDVPRAAFSSAATEVLPGRDVFVELQAAGEFHTVARASTDRFEPAPGNVLVVGKASYPPWRPPGPIQATNLPPVFVDYGLGRYYVHEGTGNPGGKLTVQAAVPKSGRPLIKQVFVDGVPYAEAMQRAGR